MFLKAIQWLAPWWASLLDKKVYVAVTFGTSVLLFLSIAWHMWDNHQSRQDKIALQVENQKLNEELIRTRKGNELLNTERINELKADRDTAFARLDRLQTLINKK